ncbi:anti-sigma factor [Marinomonas sp. A79]|uniref:Anti-sigma factor n=1 Tax=Marinomonas vulgaris TaxID=2823372 RepID=A0ABS5H8W7_9GAMM|nr:anti-sigma factor [Marinomonas vulgaris]MBR7887474.1 anti-sigma factor [Marinomonas vulgaris]
MNKDDEVNINLQAAEYVLGTLDKAERAFVENARLNRPELQQAINQWQGYFSGLNDYSTEATPRSELFNDILAKLDQQDSNLESTPNITTAMAADNIIDLQSIRRKLKRWRLIAISTSAIAACLAVFMVVKPPVTLNGQSNAPFVAVFQADDSQPAFIMSLDINTQQLTVRPVMAQEQAGKTYQLWIKSDDIGPAPKSLGLLTNVSAPIQKRIGYEAGVIRNATFGISVEPMGGSPTGSPTGPAIHGKLYPTAL